MKDCLFTRNTIWVYSSTSGDADFVCRLCYSLLFFVQQRIGRSHIVNSLSIHLKGIEDDLKKITMNILHKHLNGHRLFDPRIDDIRIKTLSQHVLYQQLRGHKVSYKIFKQCFFFASHRIPVGKILTYLDLLRKSYRPLLLNIQIIKNRKSRTKFDTIGNLFFS